MAEVFDDIEEVNADEMSSDEEDIFSTSTDMVWNEIENDSSLFSLFDSQTWINQTCYLVTTLLCICSKMNLLTNFNFEEI